MYVLKSPSHFYVAAEAMGRAKESEVKFRLFSPKTPLPLPAELTALCAAGCETAVQGPSTKCNRGKIINY